MEVLVGFIVGYYMGAKGGRERLDEIQGSYQTIAQSDEFKALLTVGGALLARAMTQQKGNGGREPFITARLLSDQLGVVASALARRAA